MLNDRTYRDDPDHASDNRWVHRPRMDWARVAERHGDGPAGRVFRGTTRLIESRRRLAALHAAVPLEVVDLGDPALFGFVRQHPSGPLLAVHNMTETPRTLQGRVLDVVGLDAAWDAIDGAGPYLSRGAIDLGPYAVRWLVAAAS
jgi:amylosucrase